MLVRRAIIWGGFTLLICLAAASPAWAAEALTNLVVPGLTPAFDPTVKQYTAPKPANCSLPVTATLTTPTDMLYIQSTLTASGATRNAYVCGGKVADVVIYNKSWKELGRYTITPVTGPVVVPPPPPPALSALVIASLSPMFSPTTKTYEIPRTNACSVPVTATLTDPTHNLYISSGAAQSGMTAQAWVCDGKTKIDIVVYKVWTEVGRYTVNVVGTPPPMDPPDMGGGDPPPGGGTPPAGPTETYPTPSPAPVYSVPAPAVVPTDVATARRLLQQASFGPNAAEMNAVLTTGRDYWLWQQIKAPASTVPDGLDINALRARVFMNMATGSDQLRQRVAFALSQIVVVSANKNTNGYEIIPYMRMLYTHALGNYRTLLREVTLSPTMGKFLDLANSSGVGKSANENYPRELMQLFTIGTYELNQNGTAKLDANGQLVPTYYQNTVREVARALSGWTYPTVSGAAYRSMNGEHFVGLMEPRPENHDKGAKTMFGVTIPASQTVTKDMDGVLDALFQHPNMPPFFATRMIRALVTHNPTQGYITRVADVFVNNGQGVRGDLAAVVLAILADPDASLPSIADGRLQDAVLNVIGLGRALDATFGDVGGFMYVLATLGQYPLTPNSVFSFFSPLGLLPHHPGLYGPEFGIYSPATAIQRANFTYDLLAGQFGSILKFDLTPFTQLAASPPLLVELVNLKLFQGQMSTPLRALLTNTAQATSDLNQRVIGTVFLAAISSEYLVHGNGSSFMSGGVTNGAFTQKGPS